MICTSIERVNGTPTAVMPSLQIKSPALPGSCSCIQSISSVKFSYICAVRKTPVGTPEHKMYGTPSSPCLTVHVSLEQLTFTQPERSFPLKSMVGSAVDAAECAQRAATQRRAMFRISVQGTKTLQALQGSPSAAITPELQSLVGRL